MVRLRATGSDAVEAAEDEDPEGTVLREAKSSDEVGDDDERAAAPAEDGDAGSGADGGTQDDVADGGDDEGGPGVVGDAGDIREAGDAQDDEAGEPGERKAYQFDGPVPVHTGGQRAVSGVMRPLHSVPDGDAAKGDGDTAKADRADRDKGDKGPGVSVAALRVVHDLNLDRLLGSDPEAREARNAKLRRAGTGVGAVALAGVLIYAVFPVRTYLDQRAATDRSREQIEMLSRENDRLEDRAESLRTDEEVERLAREQYGLVKPGEESYGVLPPPESTTTTTTTSTTSTTAPPP